MGENTSSIENPDSASTEPRRVSLVCAELGTLLRPAIEYLVLNLNTRQQDVEFEFLPIPPVYQFLSRLRPGALIDLNEFRTQALGFVTQVADDVELHANQYGRVSQPLGRVVFVSLATLDTHFYELYEAEYSAIFLGDWDSVMAPPSVLESLLSLIMMEGVYTFLGPTADRLSHFPTRGCLGDFNLTLNDARYKVLQGFLCSRCRTILASSVGPHVYATWAALLGKSWVGNLDDPISPASVVRKLGYNLFLTKGYAPTYPERLLQLLQEDGVKELLKLAGAVLLAAILVWLGFKK